MKTSQSVAIPDSALEPSASRRDEAFRLLRMCVGIIGLRFATATMRLRIAIVNQPTQCGAIFRLRPMAQQHHLKAANDAWMRNRDDPFHLELEDAQNTARLLVVPPSPTAETV
jgi:hypothetical protein